SEDAQLAVRRPDATAAAGCRATGAATAGVPRSAVRADDPFRRWSLQQLLVVPGVQAILPVPLPSALSLALAPARSGCGRDKNDAGAEAVRADGFGSLGGDAVRDRGVAVLVSPAAILILGRPNGAEGKGPAGRVGAGRTGHGLGDVVRRRGGDVWMQDVEEDEKMADEEEAREPEHIEDSDDEWGGVYTQRQCLHPQHGRQWQQQPQDYGRTHQDEEAEEERGGGGGLTALGPVGLGPWRRALILPAEVQPLPPQALLVPGSATTSAAALPSAAAAAPFFAAGAVTGLLLIDPSCDMPQVDARQMQRGRPEQEQKHGHPGGLGSGDDDGRSGVQEAGMAKVLAHMSRQWDAGVQRILEQRATLARMVHLTREAEQLMADAGQQPLPACGSAAARPPSRAALLDPLLDLEKEFLIQPQQRVRSRSAVSTRESAGPPAAGAGRGGGGDGDGDGDGTDMSAAVDKLLDQLLGCGGAGAANGGNVAATVPAAVAARSRSESAPTTIHVPTVAAAGAKAGGGEGGAAASEPQVPDNGSSWSPVLESLTQTRQAGNWVLRAVLRLESGQEAGGGGRFAAVANADGNGRGSGSDNGRSAGDKRPPVASGQQRPPLTPPPPPLQLDDVVLLPYCHSGLGLRSVLGRWEVLDRGSRRVAVEAAVPLGELLALASAAAATATPGGCLDAGSGAEWELDSESRHLRDLQIALGPLPGLFEGPNDDGDDTVYSDGCSSDTDTDIEAACNLDDGVRKSETAEDDEDRPTCGQLLWEGSMGWRCVVSLQPCGVYGCEVELSYVDGGGSGWDSWSSAALDHVQQLVTNAAGRSCEQVGRRLSLLCPNPLADSQLERMDIAAGALQRCVDATLELLEGALLAQQQQQLQQQQPRKQQQQNAARREVGTKPGFKDCTSGGVGTEAAMSAGATGARLQAMLQDVLQLQLQLHTAMETYLVT
ncbi:hypothetical protein Vretimale_11495, partial [Volvox reticuliferus]